MKEKMRKRVRKENREKGEKEAPGENGKGEGGRTANEGRKDKKKERK